MWRVFGRCEALLLVVANESSVAAGPAVGPRLFGAAGVCLADDRSEQMPADLTARMGTEVTNASR